MIKSRAVAAVTAVALVGVLAACGGQASGASAGHEATGPAKTGGVLTVGSATAIDLLNPVTQTTAMDQNLFSLLWDGLVTSNQSGQIVPDLATSWSASTNQKTWTFELRHGVKFSNGKSLTSADVVSTIKYYQAPGTTTEQEEQRRSDRLRIRERPLFRCLQADCGQRPVPGDDCRPSQDRRHRCAVNDGDRPSRDRAVQSREIRGQQLPESYRHPSYFGTASKLSGINSSRRQTLPRR